MLEYSDILYEEENKFKKKINSIQDNLVAEKFNIVEDYGESFFYIKPEK